MPYPELSLVALRDEVPLHRNGVEGYSLAAGTVGTVVFAYRGDMAYEVEFTSPYPCVITCLRWELDPA